jgi:hypothetical protein
LAAPRRPSLVVQEICRIARTTQLMPLPAICRVGKAQRAHHFPRSRKTDVTLPHIAPLMRATQQTGLRP